MSASVPAASGHSNILRFGVFELDVRALELRKHGQRIRVQQQPLQILAMLLERPGEVVTRDQLRAALWASDVYVDFDRGLNKALVKLREAIGDSATSPRFIETLPKIGYRFLASETPQQMVVPAPRRIRFVPVLAIALALLAIVSAVVVLWPRPRTIRSLAVLPLDDLSGDPSQAYFADGMTDELITAIAQIGELRVISRTSVMHYKSTRKTAPEIARELAVDAVLEGSVLRVGNRVRISAQLIDAQRDKHLWARMYEDDAKDVLRLQDTVARDVAERIRLKLMPHEAARLQRARAVNPQAYEAYLAARYHWDRRDFLGTAKALQAYRQAIVLDPSYAPAYAGIAQCYIVMTYLGEIRGTDAWPLVMDAVKKALAIDPDLAEAHTALAVAKMNYEHDWAGAESEFRRAIALNPNSVTARIWYGALLARVGRHDESFAQQRVALRLDPLSIVTRYNWAQRLWRTRRFDQAAAELNHEIDLDPNYASAHWTLGLIYVHQNKLSAAIAELHKAEELKPGPTVNAGLGYAYALSGDTGRARSILQELLKEKSRYVDPWAVALVYTGLGDRDQAFTWLEKANEDRDSLVTMLNAQPEFDTLRDDPRFNALLQRIGLPVSRDSH